MPVITVNNFRNLKNKIEKKHEKALTKIAAVVISRAKYYVPIDTAALINSDFRNFTKLETGASMSIGFVQNYALALHERLDWKPRLPGTNGKPSTSGYNPNAKPRFLVRAGEESLQDMQRIIAEEYKL